MNSQLIEEKLKNDLLGIVLVGGKSSRMGRPKGLLSYYGLPQGIYLFNLFQQLSMPPFLAVGEMTDEFGKWGLPMVEDYLPNIGPMGAIYSVQQAFPGQAFCLLACDLPRISVEEIQQLINHRANDKAVTLYRNSIHGQLEPMFSIWEPRSAPAVEAAILKQQYSLMKLLHALPCYTPIHPQPIVFHNINHPQEYEDFMQSLKNET